MMYILSQQELDELKDKDFVARVEKEVNDRLSRFGSRLDSQLKASNIKFRSNEVFQFMDFVRKAMREANLPEPSPIIAPNNKGGLITSAPSQT